MATPVDFHQLRDQCLYQLRLLRVEADNSERQLENLQLPLNAESRVALLVQLQHGVKAVYDYVGACRQLAKFLQQQPSSNP